MTSLVQALPLTNGIYNQIQFLLVHYMQNVNVWTSQIFGSASYPYIKDDLASVQRPGIFAYPKYSTKNSFSYSYTGIIILEMHFSLIEQRIDLAQNIIQIGNDIELINLNQKFTQYLQSNISGLFWFGKYCKSDYTKVYAKEAVLKIEFDFNIDLLAYQLGLQSQGYDITSPDVAIYPPAQLLLENLAVLNPDETVAFITN